ncbi:hypothetical protein DIPPA_18173 [Diplonema papillatum]|nr:hypothetical protein DIPPA_18173 [Diplonema papillatum]
MNNKAVCAGLGAVAGLAVAECCRRRVGGREDDDDDDGVDLSAAIDAAFEGKGSSSDAVDRALLAMRRDLMRAEAAAALNDPTSPHTADGLSRMPETGVDNMKGISATHEDGSRTFSREDVGLQFTMPRGWYALGDHLQPTPTGDVLWLARFGDPSQPPETAPQVVIVVEDVGKGISDQDYAGKSRRQCEESMGQFSRVTFLEDEPVSVGPFSRKLAYTQDIPIPGNFASAPPGLLELTLTNYMTVHNGIAYTLQLMSPKEAHAWSLKALDDVARNTAFLPVVTHYGKLTRTAALPRAASSSSSDKQPNLAVTITVPTGSVLVPEDAPSSVLDAVRWNGHHVDSFTNLDDPPCSVIVDLSGDAAARPLRELLQEFIAERGAAEPVLFAAGDNYVEYACDTFPPSAETVCISMARAPGSAARVCSWHTTGESLAALTPNQPPVPPGFRAAWKERVEDLATRVQLHTSPTPALSTFSHDFHGYSISKLGNGCLKEQRFGDVVLYRLHRNKPVPELQIQTNDKPQPSLAKWKEELQLEVQQAGGQLMEGSEVWIGREQAAQLVFQVPPEMGYAEGPVLLYITLISSADRSYTLQWRCPFPNFDSERAQMDEVIETFRPFKSKTLP